MRHDIMRLGLRKNAGMGFDKIVQAAFPVVRHFHFDFIVRAVRQADDRGMFAASGKVQGRQQAIDIGKATAADDCKLSAKRLLHGSEILHEPIGNHNRIGRRRNIEQGSVQIEEQRPVAHRRWWESSDAQMRHGILIDHGAECLQD